MTVGELKEFLKDKPDDLSVILYNRAYEWYGKEEILPDHFIVHNKNLYLNFGGSWDPWEIADLEALG